MSNTITASPNITASAIPMAAAAAAQPVKQPPLFVPDRYDALLNRISESSLPGMIEQVEAAEDHVMAYADNCVAAGRGGFLILRGDSGTGKSTFLHTLRFFVEHVDSVAIPRDAVIGEALHRLPPMKGRARFCILEGREALGQVSAEALEAALHDVNTFLRTPAGVGTIIVWPVNTDDLEAQLIAISNRIGAEALLGVDEPSYKFSGPEKSKFVQIANRTIATLNQGAGLNDLGISVERATEISENTPTLGRFMGILRGELIKNRGAVEGLIKKEKCRLWVVVAAGNEPEGDVDALTRGIFSSADVERLLDATGANIVAELKNFPDKLGILGTVLDARIFHLPVLTALVCARDFHGPKLEAEMKKRGLATAGPTDGIARITASTIGKALQGKTLGGRARGSKIGSNTLDAFENLVKIAATNDEILNQAIGEALVQAGLIQSFTTEQDFGNGLERRTDILCQDKDGPIRVEVMWRGKTGRADIANYVLTKLHNYGRAIGFLSFPKSGA